MSNNYFDIVFDGPPGPTAGRFVEVENPDGESIRVGTWIDRGDGLWALRIDRDACPVHYGEIHGGEAEALRQGIEALFEQHTDAVPRVELVRLLDSVSAADSLGFLDRSDDELDTLRWLRQTPAVSVLGEANDAERAFKAAAWLDRLITKLASPALDGVDQGAHAPVAVLRDERDPARPRPIGDETLDLDPTGDDR